MWTRIVGRFTKQSIVGHAASVNLLALTVFWSMEYYGPRYKLEVLPSNVEDFNTPEYLGDLKYVQQACAHSTVSEVSILQASDLQPLEESSFRS